MSSSLSPSGLIIHDYTDANWQADLLSNITRLNSTLLYLNNMGDVSVSGLLDGDVLRWDILLSKYVNTKRNITTTTTTTTTTTSSSSTSTSSSTTVTFTGTTTTFTGTTTTITGSTTTSSSTTTTTVPPAPSYTAKSVIFDAADRWNLGDGYTSIRSIDFWYDGSKITMTSGFTAYATSSFSSSYLPAFAFDTSLSKIGGYTNKEWLTSSTTNQRLIIVFDSPVTFDSIVINNSHDAGGIKGGMKNVVINISTDAITDTTYNAAISNSTEIFDGQFDSHTASDIEDPQTLTLV